MAKTVQEALDDPSFKTLSPEVQRAVLGKLGVSPDVQQKVLLHLGTVKSKAQEQYDAYLKSGQPTSERREPGKGTPATFMTRASHRVAENLRPIGHPMELATDISRSIAEGKKHTAKENLIATGKGLIEPFTDPAKLTGDVITGAMFGAAAGEPSTGTRKPTARTVAPEVRTGLTPEQHTAYSEALDRANRDHATALSDYADKESRRQAQWAEKAYGAKKSESDQVAAASKRQVLDRGSMEYANRTLQNIRDTHQTVRSRLDSRWHDFRQQMSGATVDKTNLYRTIADARARLQGAPADLKQFTDFVRTMGIEVNDAGEITIPEGQTIEMPLDTARVHSTAIGEKLAQGDLPGNVYQALKEAKTGIETQIEGVADQYGMGDTYRGLKRDWSKYMQDWNDMRAVGTGKGSVLARALRVPSPEYLRPLLTGKGGDLLLQDLGQYRDAGANPSLAQNTRQLATKAKGIKAGPARAMPSSYEPLAPPKLREVPVPKPKPPSLRTAPRGAKIAGRLTGKLVGGAIGTAAGHPFLGYAAGGEIGGELVERFYRERPRPPLPPGFELPAEATGTMTILPPED